MFRPRRGALHSSHVAKLKTALSFACPAGALFQLSLAQGLKGMTVSRTGPLCPALLRPRGWEGGLGRLAVNVRLLSRGFTLLLASNVFMGFGLAKYTWLRVRPL